MTGIRRAKWGRTEENCRQIAARARRRIEARRPRFAASEERRRALAQRFFDAVIGGDLNGLVGLLAADASFQGDGGGKARSFPRPIAGADPVARLLIGLLGKLLRAGGRVERVAVNGQPGALTRDAEGRILSVLSMDLLDDGRVHAIRSVVNPDKLAHLGPVSDWARIE